MLRIQRCIISMTLLELQPNDHTFTKYINTAQNTMKLGGGDGMVGWWQCSFVSNIMENGMWGFLDQLSNVFRRFWAALNEFFSHMATLFPNSPQTNIGGGLRSRSPSFGVKRPLWIYNLLLNGWLIVWIHVYSVCLRLSYESTTMLIVWSLR